MVKIIGITGGKGGTGKSTVAVALAYSLSKKGKTLLVDADVDCPDDHLLLGIELIKTKEVMQRIPKFDHARCLGCGECRNVCKNNAIISVKGQGPSLISQQCNGCGSCKFICNISAIEWQNKQIGSISCGSNFGIDLLSGELKPNEPVSELVVNSLNSIIQDKKNEYEYIIIDTAAGTHCPVIAALEICDLAFAVTEPTPLGKHDLDIILQLIKKIDIPVSVVLNRSDIGDKNIIINLSSKSGVDICAEIPYSKEIAKSYAKGIPISNEGIRNIVKVIFGEQ